MGVPASATCLLKMKSALFLGKAWKMPKTPGGRFKVSHSMQEKIILTRRQDLLLSLLEWVGTIYGTGVRSTLRLLWMQNMDICTQYWQYCYFGESGFSTF